MARWSAKLPTASVTNAWSLDDLPDPPGFWQAVGETTARHLGVTDAEARERAGQAVAAAIESYVRDAEDEASAVPVAAAQARAAEVRRVASALAQALGAPRTPKVAQAESLIEEAAGGDPALSFRALHDGAHALAAACDRALARLDELAGERHFAPGEAWERFIAALADTFEAATGGAATASKDHDNAQVSRFGRFAHAIQVLLPPRFWRHPVATANSQATADPGGAFSLAVARALAVRRARAQVAPAAPDADPAAGSQNPAAPQE